MIDAPPGESSDFALEDAVLFSHLLSSNNIADTFSKYESVRKSHIDSAYAEADLRWENIKDMGWLQCKIREWITPWFLWWTQAKREKTFAADVRTLQ